MNIGNGTESQGIDADASPVTSHSNDWNIAVLRDKRTRGMIDLQPEFQREYVWNAELKSRLIESLLLDIPIPPVYLGKLPGQKMDVIDGQQRLTTLLHFADNLFRLEKLQRLTSLNGSYFRDLPSETQDKILDTTIHSVVIDTGNNPTLRYDIFERFNRGSVKLEEQELRNCAFRGPFNSLLKQLESGPTWRKIQGSPKPERHFKEREMILRFFAFANRIDNYAGNLKRFLNEYMGLYAPTDPQLVAGLEATFNQTMRNVYNVFGTHSGRLYSAGTEANPIAEGRWDRKFSILAFDIQASALNGQNPQKVQEAAEQIREAYLFYLLTNPQVRQAISRQTGSTSATKTRWFGFKAEVQRLLSDISLEPRFFSYDYRRQLFEANPICRLCGNEIHSFDDSTVDHIIPYAKGGKTVPENGQLAHRSCNSKKCANLLDI
jgi:hypothetical protein